MTPRQILPILLLAATAALSACAAHQPYAPSKGSAPQWAMKGSGAFDENGKNVFYGVGIAGNIKNHSLRRSASDDRGRAELAKVMNSYVTVLSKDYQASTSAGGDATSEEQHVQQTLKNFAKFTLHGSMPVDHWIAEDGTEYALVKLDMDAVKKSLDSAKELDGAVRDYVRANADKAFDELQGEASKN